MFRGKGCRLNSFLVTYKESVVSHVQGTTVLSVGRSVGPVGSVGSGRSGRVGSVGSVGSGLGSGRSGRSGRFGRVGSGRVGSGRVGSGRSVSPPLGQYFHTQSIF